LTATSSLLAWATCRCSLPHTRTNSFTHLHTNVTHAHTRTHVYSHVYTSTSPRARARTQIRAVAPKQAAPADHHGVQPAQPLPSLALPAGPSTARTVGSGPGQLSRGCPAPPAGPGGAVAAAVGEMSVRATALVLPRAAVARLGTAAAAAAAAAQWRRQLRRDAARRGGAVCRGKAGREVGECYRM
jgi:hypothetical protein